MSKKSSLFKELQFVLVLVVLLFPACELDPDFQDLQPNTIFPKANFTFTKATQPCNTPCTVNFTSTSSNALTFLWDFGDGNMSQNQNPSNTYQSKGTYNVKLTASNNAGSRDTILSVQIEDAAIPTFFKTYGGSGADVGTSVIQTQDEFYLISGYSNSPDLLNGPTTDHLILWRFDVLGGKVWTLPRSLKPNSYGNALIQDVDDNYVIVGYERNTLGEPMIETPIFVKYNSAGTLLTTRDLENPLTDFVTYTVLADIIDVGNQYAVTGYSDLCRPGCPHILLSYLNADGTVIEDTWSTDSFAGNDARGRSIAKSPLRVASMGDEDGNIIIRENPGINSMTFVDNEFIEGGSQTGNDMVGTSDGTFAIVGSTDNGSNGGFDVLFFVVDNNFEKIGDYVNIGGGVSDFGVSIIAFEDDFIIAGSSNSFSSNGNFDVLIIRISKDGQVIWQETYDNADGDEFASEIVVTSDGGFTVVGYTEDSGSDKDIFLLKTDASGRVAQ